MSILKGTIKIASGTFVAQILSIFAIPLLTKFYTPNQMGVYYLFMSLLNLFGPVSFLRLDQAVLSINNIDQELLKRNALYAALSISIFFTLISSVLIIFKIAGYGNLPKYAIFLLFIWIFLNGLYLFQRSSSLKDYKYTKLGKSQIARTLGKFCYSIPLSLLHASPIILISSESIGLICGHKTLDFKLIKSIFVNRKLNPFLIFNRFKLFIINDSISAIINALGIMGQVPVLAVLFGKEEVALYGLAVQIAAIPNFHLGKAIADSFHTNFASYIVDHNPLKAISLYQTVLKKLFFTGLIVYAFIVIFAPIFSNLFFDNKWKDVGTIVSCVSPWLFFSLISSIFPRILLVVNKQKIKLIYDILSLLGLFLSFYLIHYLNTKFIGGILIISFTRCTSYIVLILITQLNLKKWIFEYGQ